RRHGVLHRLGGQTADGGNRRNRWLSHRGFSWHERCHLEHRRRGPGGREHWGGCKSGPFCFDGAVAAGRATSPTSAIFPAGGASSRLILRDRDGRLVALFSAVGGVRSGRGRR